VAQPSPSQIVANIQRALAEDRPPVPEPSVEPRSEGAPPAPTGGYPPPDNPRALFEVLERNALPEMRRREAVDQLSGNGLAGVLKRLAMRVMRLISGPQAAFNRKTIEAVEITAGDVDLLRQRVYWDVRGLHERLAAAEEQNRRALEEAAAVRAQLARETEERAALLARVDALASRLAALETRADRDSAQLATLTAALDSLATKQEIWRLWDEVKQIYSSIDARASQADMAKVWEEIPLLVQAISERASQADMEKVWLEIPRLVQAISERASQPDMTRVWEEIPRLVAAIEAQASQADMEKVWLEIPRLVQAISERASQADMTKVWVEIPKLVEAIEGRASHADVASVRAELGPIWTQISSLDHSINDQVGGVWRGIAERDAQQERDFAAIKALESITSAQGNDLREARARLLTLREQVQWLEENGASAPAPASHTASGPAPTAVPTPRSGDDIQRRLDRAYLQFQRLYRGDEAELKARLSRYVPILRGEFATAPSRVLDVACGDGIFLERLAEEGWSVSGVDINSAMVRVAVERGLDVSQCDALDFLDGVAPASFDAITALQFVEHLPPDVLFRFLMGAFKALRPGGLLLIETINPHTLKALHWFHLDLSHARLVYPEMLGLLCETAGFASFSWKGINPVAEHERLASPASEADRANIERLNQVLFGEQDYYLIGRKNARA